MSTLLLSLSQQVQLASLYDEQIGQRLLLSTKYYGQIEQRLPLYYGQIGQRLLLSTTGAAEELVPTRDIQCVHPPTHLASRALQPVFMLHRCVLFCLHS